MRIVQGKQLSLHFDQVFTLFENHKQSDVMAALCWLELLLIRARFAAIHLANTDFAVDCTGMVSQEKQYHPVARRGHYLRACRICCQVFAVIKSIAKINYYNTSRIVLYALAVVSVQFSLIATMFVVS